ncbi:hypothetical protein HO173_003116 [Letharia columbiana]|uniref:Uncharacterized protein n=1 Tax=Letharia columbiana TaxID=112416 RepID=A0A8H6G1F1_9LECA|nr:uncharacterized protein HO173_003116 [Letharia columbiana]KAF6238610.1 hypothetical protein HO173_003116 [Letharia columbiana]
MGCHTDLAGNSSCGFHYSGLPCPLESSRKRHNAPYAVAFDTTLFASLTLIDQPSRPFIRQVPPDCPFLALPGEIRNRIYRFALVAIRPFTVQLQWNRPRDTALLRVNKQIFDEASSIFYAENVFRFPEALFVGAPILPQLQTLYRVSRAKLKMMRHIVLEVPVYGLNSNFRFRIQTAFNLRHLTEFLACSPNVKVQLRFGYVWGENGRDLGPNGCAYQDASEVYGRVG